MSMFEKITPDEQERYFVNLSDGEPCYSLRVPLTGEFLYYGGEVGASHTQQQINKIRSHGIEILSYFIEEEMTFRSNVSSTSKNLFKKMYGKNAKFIDVESIIGLADTINSLFLSKKK